MPSKQVFLEHPEQFFRKEDYADKIINLRHTGWYTDDICFGILRGVVFKLAKGRGYLAGYEELEDGKNYNDGALVELEIVHDKEQAAREADRLAELAAEKERWYQEAWQAGRQVEDLKEEALRAWSDVKQLSKTPKTEARDRAMRRLLQDITSNRAEIEKLTDEFGDEEGFKDA